MAYGGFGGGNMQQLMKQAQAMQRKLQEAQQELADSEVTGSAAGGMTFANAVVIAHSSLYNVHIR